MQKLFSLAFAVLAISAPLTALGADSSLGTWKANVAASTYSPAPWPVKSLTVVREATSEGVKVTTTGERTDGTAINASYTAKYDGAPAAVTGQGAPYDSVSIKKVNANTFIYDAKNTTGKYHAHGRIVISKNGKTMTLTAKGMDMDGKAMSVKVIYDKE